MNRYTAFIYLLCERDSDFFYESDLKILVEIVVRELELYRSGTHHSTADLNQMINLQLLRVLITYHGKLLAHKRQDIHSIVSEVSSLGPIQNREIAQEICVLIG